MRWSRKLEGMALTLAFSASLLHAQVPPKIPVYFKEKEVWVEVAKTPEERAQGLMGRRHLGDEEGMLFIFDREGIHSFWMKNTVVPLSIAFMDRDGKILRIAEMEPLTLESHAPPQPILYALEMKKGWFRTHGIRAGDVMRFSK